MGKLKTVFFLLLLVQSMLVAAQVSEKYNSEYARFYTAEDLFEKQKYSAAEKEFNTFSVKSVSVTLFFSILIIIGFNFLIDSFLWKIIVFSILGLIIGNFVPKWNHALVLKLGGLSIICIMAILGLKLNFNNLSMPFNLVLFVIIWLISHFIIMMIAAKKMKLHMAWVPIASMANLGGISTAPAVTAAYNKEWMPHAILLAILSMVSGTFWGMLTMYLFGLF